MHTYKRTRDGDGYIWTVGHYELEGDEHYSSASNFVAMQDFTDERMAAAYVNYLNGGEGKLR